MELPAFERSGRVLPRLPALLTALLTVLALLCAGCSGPREVRESWPVFGDTATATLYVGSETAGEETMRRVREALEEFERDSDPTDPESRISRLNREAVAGPFAVEDEDFYRCLKLITTWARATRGDWDPTYLVERPDYQPPEGALVPTYRSLRFYDEARSVRLADPRLQLDLSAVARGYAVDLARRSFVAFGVDAGKIELGPVAYVSLAPPGQAGWEVPLRDADSGADPVGSLNLVTRGVAVRGSFASLRGQAAPAGAAGGLEAVAVTADSAGDAEVIATAIQTLGPQEAAALIARSRRVEAVMLIRGPEGPYLLASASLERKLSLLPEALERVGGQVRFLLEPARL